MAQEVGSGLPLCVFGGPGRIPSVGAMADPAFGGQERGAPVEANLISSFCFGFSREVLLFGMTRWVTKFPVYEALYRVASQQDQSCRHDSDRAQCQLP